MEIREEHHEDDTTCRTLYEAAVAGSVSCLERLIQKDPLILNKVSLTQFSETPLHISALLGHLDFTKTLLTHNSRLANVTDSLRRLPLLLASAEGHKETVQALLKANPNACLFRDQHGRIPLHYAAMRGHADVLAELLHAKPESVTLSVLDRGNTVFHLCVTYNQLECLKLLVEEVGDVTDFLNAGSGAAAAGSDGGMKYEVMNILELAVMLRQTEAKKKMKFTALETRFSVKGEELMVPIVILDESLDLRNIWIILALAKLPEFYSFLYSISGENKTVKYLLSLPTVRSEAELLHGKVFKMLENSPRDFASLELQRVLIDAGIKTNGRNEHEKLPIPQDKSKKEGKKGARKVKEKRSKSGSWVEEKRGMLMVVATMISTMTFQAAINPPGGFWQEMNTNTTFNGTAYCSETNPCFAGTAVSSYIHRDTFIHFQTYDTICFLFSLSITLLLISGVPIHKRVLVWLMSIVICLTLTFLALAFKAGIKLVIPKPLHGFHLTTDYLVIGSATLFWVPLVILVALYNTIRLLVWLVKKLWRLLSLEKRMTINNNANPHQPPIISHGISSHV